MAKMVEMCPHDTQGPTLTGSNWYYQWLYNKIHKLSIVESTLAINQQHIHNLYILIK